MLKQILKRIRIIHLLLLIKYFQISLDYYTIAKLVSLKIVFHITLSVRVYE